MDARYFDIATVNKLWELRHFRRFTLHALAYYEDERVEVGESKEEARVFNSLTYPTNRTLF